jgi:hypothetical protein
MRRVFRHENIRAFSKYQYLKKQSYKFRRKTGPLSGFSKVPLKTNRVVKRLIPTTIKKNQESPCILRITLQNTIILSVRKEINGFPPRQTQILGVTKPLIVKKYKRKGAKVKKNQLLNILGTQKTGIFGIFLLFTGLISKSFIRCGV